MTYVIAAPCLGTKDRSCVRVCPVDCILDDGDQFVIDPEVCVDCGACVPACPVSAIFELPRLPSTWRGFAQHNAQRAAALRVTASTAELAGAGARFPA